MAREFEHLVAFNRGRVSEKAFGRTGDLKRIALGASVMTNFIPTVLGSMSLRPGFGLVGSVTSEAIGIPFVYDVGDTAIVELTDYTARVWVNDAVITRASVSTAVANGTLLTDLTSWTDSDEAGATSSYISGMALVGNGSAAAIRDQQVTVAAGDQGVVHALDITVAGGKCYVAIGSTQGGSEYFDRALLRAGHHSLAFTPVGNFWIRFSNESITKATVTNCTIDTAGAMEVTTPWPESALPDIRWDMTGDVIFLACRGYPPQRIERRAGGSWSVVEYAPEDGPFRPANVGPTKITPSALSGTINLVASHDAFKATNVGAIYRIASNGQLVEATITTDNTFSDPIRIVGVGTSRTHTVTVAASGTFPTKVTLQQARGTPTDWTDIATYTAAGTFTYTDSGNNNQIIYRRVGVKSGNLGGAGRGVAAQLSHPSGTIEGVARIATVVDTKNATADVLKSLGNTTASDDWSEGAWSSRRGYPSAVTFHDGRLWWAWASTLGGSVVDGYDSFDKTVEGDSGPIVRGIAIGGADKVSWVASANNLLIGTTAAELVARASSIDDPLTPSAFSLKPISTQGSLSAPAVTVDASIVFTHRSGEKLFEAQLNDTGFKYDSQDLSALLPDVGSPGIVRLAVQRHPDTRLYAVRSDGTVAMLVYDRLEKVTAWCDIEMDGKIEDMLVLPTATGDAVYAFVMRVVNSVETRYLVKMTSETECVGGLLNKQADLFVVYDGAATTTITGLDHLEGEEVVVWADGKDVGPNTVGEGFITLATAASKVVVGLSYTAQFESAPKMFGAHGLVQRGIINHVGLILANTHVQGLRYGQDFSYLDELPLIVDGAAVDVDTVSAYYTGDSVEVNGSWSVDTRLCLEAEAPRPATVLAAVVSGVSHDKV